MVRVKETFIKLDILELFILFLVDLVFLIFMIFRANNAVLFCALH